MTDFPDLKLKTLVNFPARASGGTGIEVTKTDGAYTVDLDYSDFAPPTESVPDPTNQTALIWNSVTEAYTLIPISELVDSSGLHVLRAGDTMSDDLNISCDNPALVLNDLANGFPDLRFRRAGNDRWIMRANNDTESGGNAGSSFQLIGLLDAGGVAGVAIQASRVDSRITLAGDPTSDLHAATKQYVDAVALVAVAANASINAGVAAAVDVAIAVRNSLQTIPDTFSPGNFTALKIQLDALTEVLVAMLQAQANPPQGGP